MCYIFCSGIDPENELEYIRIVDNAIKSGLLEKDCTVKDAEKFIQWLTGRKTSVSKKAITEISDIENPTPIRYRADDRYGHWVVVENGRIVFNSLANSINVTKGKPVEARIIKWGLKK